MKFMYCPQCGSQLEKKEIGDEGLVPYCETCKRPWFDMPYACTITLVINELEEVALIRQGYVSDQYYVCVAGYIKCGESAEETARREVMEELGLNPESLCYTKSYYFEKIRDRNVKWKNRKHTVPLKEGRLWVKG